MQRRMIKQGYTSNNDSICIYVTEKSEFQVVIRNIGSQIVYSRTFKYLGDAEKRYIKLSS